MTEAEITLEQDPLPGMPSRPKRKPKAAPSPRPAWKRVTQPRTKPAVMCSECSMQAASGELAIEKVQRAVWRRTIGTLHAHLCVPHAEPLRSLDGADRHEDQKEKRAWRKKKR